MTYKKEKNNNMKIHYNFLKEAAALRVDDEKMTVLIEYISAWTENYPATYPDGETLCDKYLSVIERLLKQKQIININDYDIFEYFEQSDEYDPKMVLDFYYLTDDELKELYQLEEFVEEILDI